MKHNTLFFTKAISLLSLSFLTFISFAQEKQGNIVQYFGKEKVEEVREGEIVHLFKEGLILRKTGFRFNQEAVPSDPMIAKILTDENHTIKSGVTEQISGQSIKWEPIRVGEKSEFNDPGLRSGYLYLEYDAPKAKTVLFEGSGHTMMLINGMPHEGDHYDFGWQLIPVKLKKGTNKFLLTGGRFPHMRARLLEAKSPVQFTQRDMTLPDLLIEEDQPLWGAIRVMNTTKKWFHKGSIVCKIGNEELTTPISSVSPMNIRKLPFQIPNQDQQMEKDSIMVEVLLKNEKGKIIASETIRLEVKSKFKHHKRTFISQIDGSVQYYSIAPSSNKDIDNPALFLSVHGASVEAVNQARAYRQKDWGHLVAPTNRRPFGFAWEDWGRLDALEVLANAEDLLKTDPQHTYLTGHSMGGHGTWYLGATYPDKFAAIAPCAGYPDLLGYRESFIKRMKDMPEEDFARFGMTKSEFLEMANRETFFDGTDILMDRIIRRAGTPSRTLKLKRNYLHYGIFVLHGEKDNVVPTFIAREMREVLGKFHNDFTYYEYPDGTHWYGDHSVDWPPIFDFFKARSIKSPADISKIEFSTGSPGVSSGSHFIHILQQEKPFDISSFDFKRTEKVIEITTTNTQTLAIDLGKMSPETTLFSIDGQKMEITKTDQKIFLTRKASSWVETNTLSKAEKGPHRNGGFKDAFRHDLVFVYATGGSDKENTWYYNKAKMDAEKFWYRANGNVEIIPDTEFSLNAFSDRNIILYGNSDNNKAWEVLLKDCPVQVANDKIQFGDKVLTGDQWGSYFIFPRQDSDSASIGVVTASGEKGMKGAYANDYLVNGTTFPDLMIFDNTMMKLGLPGIKCSGFFGNDWSVKEGDFIWRHE